MMAILVSVCAWCHPDVRGPGISHGICPGHAARLRSEYREIQEHRVVVATLIRCYSCARPLGEPTPCPTCLLVTCEACLIYGGCRRCVTPESAPEAEFAVAGGRR